MNTHPMLQAVADYFHNTRDRTEWILVLRANQEILLSDSAYEYMEGFKRKLLDTPGVSENLINVIKFRFHFIQLCRYLGLDDAIARLGELERVSNHFNKACEYERQECFQQALEEYSHAIEIDPVFAEGYTNRSGIYVELDDFRNAVEDAKRALEIDSKNGIAYLNMGVAFASMGQYRAAFECGKKAMELGAPNAGEFTAQVQKAMHPVMRFLHRMFGFGQ